jgi:hypothetical protein
MKHLLAQPMVTTVVMRREGVSLDKLHFRVLGIATWRVEMPHLQIQEMQNHESALCISTWSQTIGHIDGRWRKKLEVLSFTIRIPKY